jgi:hypothetical protein
MRAPVPSAAVVYRCLRWGMLAKGHAGVPAPRSEAPLPTSPAPAVSPSVHHCSPVQSGCLADRNSPVALVVSDRAWAARALDIALADEGWTTLRAGTPSEALVISAASDPDLVLVEHHLDGPGAQLASTGPAARSPGG